MQRAQTLLDRLVALAPDEEHLVPAHGAFRHKQTVGDEHTLTVIDWDGICLASPALDAATFLARLHKESWQEPGGAPEMERAASGFRRAFLELLPQASAQLALYEGLVLTGELLGAMGRALRSQPVGEFLLELAQGAEAALDQFLSL